MGTFFQAGNRAKKDMMALIDAARGAYQTALSEGLPLAHIAEQSGRPQYWFASNILQIVAVQGQKPGEETPTALTRECLTGLKLSEDMTLIVDTADGHTCFEKLCLTAAEYERYLAWARTVY